MHFAVKAGKDHIGTQSVSFHQYLAALLNDLGSVPSLGPLSVSTCEMGKLSWAYCCFPKAGTSPDEQNSKEARMWSLKAHS